jgi:hypothetical protein
MGGPAVARNSMSAAQPHGSSPASGTAESDQRATGMPAGAAIELTSMPGQYRPGGTSDYTADLAGHVEIATRPSTPESGTPGAAIAPATSPSPIAPIPYYPATGIGGRTY